MASKPNRSSRLLNEGDSSADHTDRTPPGVSEAGSADGDGNGAPADPDVCRVTVSRDAPMPTRFESGPEDCDYYFPSEDGRQTTYGITSDVIIEPGVVLVFGPRTVLDVDGGSIHAVGTASGRIVFSGAEARSGYWDGICFRGNRASRLENVDVRWGGHEPLPSVRCRGGIGGYSTGEPVDIVNTTVMGSYTNGLNVHHLQLGEFRENAFSDNGEYGVNIEASQVRLLDAASDYLGDSLGGANGKPFVFTAGTISGPGPRSDPASLHEWPALNAPYRVTDDEAHYAQRIMVEDATALAFAAGSTVYFDGDSQLLVTSGSFLGTAGTAEDPVLFTSQAGAAGSWFGVSVINAYAVLNATVIEWAGRDTAGTAASLAFTSTGDTTRKELNGVHIRGSASCALWIDDEELFDNIDVTFGDDMPPDERYC